MQNGTDHTESNGAKKKKKSSEMGLADNKMWAEWRTETGVTINHTTTGLDDELLYNVSVKWWWKVKVMPAVFTF